MSHSEQIHEIAGALASAQLEMTSASKNCTNPHFKSKYADINDFILAVRPSLAKHGIAISQMPDITDHGMVLETMLIHSKSGQWLKSSWPINVKSDGRANELHALGSALTYLRRFCLSAITGIASDEDLDDDANSAKDYQAPAPKQTASTMTKPAFKIVNKEQALEFQKVIPNCSPDFKTKTEKYMKDNGFQSCNDLPEQIFKSIMIAAIPDSEAYQASIKEQTS